MSLTSGLRLIQGVFTQSPSSTYCSISSTISSVLGLLTYFLQRFLKAITQYSDAVVCFLTTRHQAAILQTSSTTWIASSIKLVVGIGWTIRGSQHVPLSQSVPTLRLTWCDNAWGGHQNVGTSLVRQIYHFLACTNIASRVS